MNTIMLAGKAIGAISGVLASAMWIIALWAPAPSLPLTGASFVTAVVMAFLAIFAVIASVRSHGVVLVVLFFASFFPVGVYLLGIPHWLRWVAFCNLGYLLAGLVIWRSTRNPAKTEAGNV